MFLRILRIVAGLVYSCIYTAKPRSISITARAVVPPFAGRGFCGLLAPKTGKKRHVVCGYNRQPVTGRLQVAVDLVDCRFFDSFGKHQLLMSMFKKSNANGQNTDGQAGTSHRQINIIGQGTIVEGTIETDENIRIGGTVHGEVNSSGRVVIAESGRIEGDVNAQSADVAGQVQGEVRVDDRLLIRTSAVIMGNIQTEQLAVEEGGRFTGRCIMNGGDIESMTRSKDENTVVESEGAAEESDAVHKEQSAAAA